MPLFLLFLLLFLLNPEVSLWLPDKHQSSILSTVLAFQACLLKAFVQQSTNYLCDEKHGTIYETETEVSLAMLSMFWI